MPVARLDSVRGPDVFLARQRREGPVQGVSLRSRLWLAEVVATLGLLLVIFGVVRSGRSGLAPFAVGAYLAGAYWFPVRTGSPRRQASLTRR